MINGKVNVVIDAFWGSSGKGKLCSFLGRRYAPDDISASNMPNAGHTVVDGDKKYVFKVLPSAAAVCPADIWLGPGTVYDPSKLNGELDMANSPGELRVHSRAVPWRQSDKDNEAKIASIQGIASTSQGCATAMTRKRNREPDAVSGVYDPHAWSDEVHDRLTRGSTWLHEVSQGWALSLDWGTHYPHCTSRNCTTQGALDEVGVAPSYLGDVYLNLRPYPIRVGNTPAGNSGGWWWDQVEVDWKHVADTCGMKVEDLEKAELTTVTKRLRRVATFSYDLLKRAARHNGATKLVLNFANYVCPGVAGLRGEDFSILPKACRIFVDSLELATNLPVVGVGTGPDVEDMVWRT